jgi:hypothetical protein
MRYARNAEYVAILFIVVFLSFACKKTEDDKVVAESVHITERKILTFEARDLLYTVLQPAGWQASESGRSINFLNLKYNATKEKGYYVTPTLQCSLAVYIPEYTPKHRSNLKEVKEIKAFGSKASVSVSKVTSSPLMREGYDMDTRYIFTFNGEPGLFVCTIMAETKEETEKIFLENKQTINEIFSTAKIKINKK